MSSNEHPTLFNLQPYGKPSGGFQCVVRTPQPTEPQVVMAAWAYAVRYTAKGLDLPDHEEALKMLKERHPSWDIIQTSVPNVSVNLSLADNDKPESS